LCGDCPLRVECLAGAVERAEPWGVWGGEARRRRRRSPPARPRRTSGLRPALLLNVAAVAPR
ncbi:WhiB family transcriptional regulator, partial [Micromonospora taraxaci]|uniref:WhiB family transcriptional regulator n=1 Tax=Micromonospora taraxaci TaxID=1316803 RepID=UPI0033AA69C8